MIFRQATIRDLVQISTLHREEIQGGFLSTLPPKLLEIIYLSVIRSKNGVCVVAEEENKEIVGFIAGTGDIKELYFYLITHFFLQISWFVFKESLRKFSINKFIDLIFYPTKEKDHNKAELLTVAVKNQFQGRGVAGEILKFFILKIKEKDVFKFNVVVGKDLAYAIRFYEKNGFQLVKETAIHSGKPSLIYTYNIKK